MTDKTRRKFICNFLKEQTVQCLRGFSDGIREAIQEGDLDRFFESDESSYALTLAYPDEILLETAKNNGVDIENRSKREIVKELIKQREDY